MSHSASLLLYSSYPKRSSCHLQQIHIRQLKSIIIINIPLLTAIFSPSLLLLHLLIDRTQEIAVSKIKTTHCPLFPVSISVSIILLVTQAGNLSTTLNYFSHLHIQSITKSHRFYQIHSYDHLKMLLQRLVFKKKTF